MKIRPNTWDSFILKSVYADNEYGLPDSMRGQVVIDIGAHIGGFAMACKARGAAEIHCYEPDPENFKLLNINASEHSGDSKVQFYPFPVTGDAVSGLGMRHPTEHDFDLGRNTGHADIFGEPGDIQSIGIQNVLDAVGNADLLKIDCEGAEWGIFANGNFRRVRRIIAELHRPPNVEHPLVTPYNSDLSTLTTAAVARLESQGFNVVVTETAPGVLGKLVAEQIQVTVRSVPKLLWVGDACNVSGYARVTENICRRLVNRGWEVHVLGVGYDGDPHTLPYRVYPTVSAVYGGQRSGINRIKELVERIQPDVIVIHDDSWNVSIFVDQMAIQNLCVPTVAYLAIDSENVRRDTATQLHNVRHAICHTAYGVRQLMKAGFVGKTSTAGHGVDSDLYAPYDRMQARAGIRTIKRANMEDSFIWGVVGVNQPRKRLDLSMAYFAKWLDNAGRPDNAFLYIHTNQNGVWDLHQLADYLNIRGHILVTEGDQQLLNDQMPTLYNAFDVMISTAEGESWGLTSLESMSCGIPNIAVRCGGMPEWASDAIAWVEPSVYGFTPNRTNTKRWIASESDFVRMMDLFYTHKDFREEYSKRGRALAETLTWDRVAEHFHTVLSGIVRVHTSATSVDSLQEFAL